MRIDTARLRAFITANIHRLCEHFYPEGTFRDGHEWRCGNVYGKPGNSFAIELKGPKAGLCNDRDGSFSGDFIKALCIKLNVKYPDAVAAIEHAMGVTFRIDNDGSTNGEKFNWQNYVSAVTEKDLPELARWRGLSPEFSLWLRDKGLIGRYRDQWAFPVSYDGQIVAAHCRFNPKSPRGKAQWYYKPKLSIGVQPIILGKLEVAQTIHCFEGQWDQLTLSDKLALNHAVGVATISTRGASNHELFRSIPKNIPDIILWPQNDEAGHRWLQNAIDILADRLPRIARVPKEFKDLGEWVKAGATDQDIQAAIESAKIADALDAIHPGTDAAKQRSSNNGTFRDQNNEGFSEEALAIQLGKRVGPLRCTGDTWYVSENGVWKLRDRSEFSPLALSVLAGLPENLRTQRLAKDVQSHLEMRSQVPRSTFCGAMRFGPDGEVMIALENGTLIIPAKEGEEARLTKTDREHGFTIALPVNYNPDAVPETFARVLIESVPDPQERDLFLDVLATALIPDCRYEMALVAIGETGAGKSTVASPLAFIFGAACSFLSLADLCHPQGYKVSVLEHKALNIGTELDVLEFEDSGLLKQLISGETFTARAIYGRPFEMRNQATMLFLANSLPRFKHGTQAEVRRLGFVRFNHKPDKPDVTLKAKVAADAEGLFAELVRRAQELLGGRPIAKPGQWGKETAERFAVTNDPIGEFVARHCVAGSNLSCEKAHLLSAFEEFRERFGLSDKLDERSFFKILYDRFPTIKQRKIRIGDGRSRIIVGITLKDDE